jgi:hypothetical protein
VSFHEEEMTILLGKNSHEGSIPFARFPLVKSLQRSLKSDFPNTFSFAIQHCPVLVVIALGFVSIAGTDGASLTARGKF